MAKPTNLSALNRTLRVLKDRWGPEHAAELQMLRSLAAAVDTAPTRAALWEQYRAALKDLFRDDDGDGELDRFLADLQRGASLGDATPA